MQATMLIVDDEYGIREFLYELFKQEFRVFLAEDGNTAIRLLEEEIPDIVLLDMRMPDISGLDVLKHIHKLGNNTVAIMITADRDIEDVVEAMRLGAYDYLIKPVDFQKLRILVKNALEKKELTDKVKYLQKEINHRLVFPNFIGESPAMKEVFIRMENVLNNDVTVLITGESGTGKEVVARSIHYQGNRKDQLFVPVDCASIPDSLIETELFGYEKGAFTGASKTTPGKFELADGGTLFLDEIPNIPLGAQAKLLRVIQEREFTRVGGSRKIKVDVRIVSASNKDLKKLTQSGKFREDLYYRLNVIPIHLPPLRERLEDIPVLVKYFLNETNLEYDRNVQLSPEVIRRMIAYSWPGNVRELKNLIKRLVLMTRGNKVEEHHLPPEFFDESGDNISMFAASPFENLNQTLEELEADYIRQVFKRTRYHISNTSKILGISRKTLYQKIKKYGIQKSVYE